MINYLRVETTYTALFLPLNLNLSPATCFLFTLFKAVFTKETLSRRVRRQMPYESRGPTPATHTPHCCARPGAARQPRLQSQLQHTVQHHRAAPSPLAASSSSIATTPSPATSHEAGPAESLRAVKACVSADRHRPA